MKHLSEALESLQKALPEKICNTSPTPQRGLTVADGKMNLPTIRLSELTDLAKAGKLTDTATVDRSLKAALKLLPKQSVRCNSVIITDKDGQFLTARDYYQLDCYYEQIKELHRTLEIINQPSPQDVIGRELYAMSISMAKRKDDDGDYKMLIVIYTQDLAEYPQDVVVEACREIRRTEKFFPTISELRELCDDKVWLRKSLLKKCREKA